MRRKCRGKLTPDTHDGEDTTMTDPEAEYDVLIRCTQGETKFSARVSTPF